MHTVDLFEQATKLARQLGYTVRFEWLEGAGGGGCEFGGQKWIFVDLSLSAAEQLGQVLDAIRHDAAAERLIQTPALRRVLSQRKAA